MSRANQRASERGTLYYRFMVTLSDDDDGFRFLIDELMWGKNLVVLGSLDF